MMRISMIQLILANFVAVDIAVGGPVGQDTITCEMEMTDNTYPDARSFNIMKEMEDEWNCFDESDILYDLDGDWKRIFQEYSVRSGESYTFRGVTIVPEPDQMYGLPTIVIHKDSHIDAVPQVENRRKLAVVTFGTNEVLVVRVTDASGNEPRLNAADISNRVFSTSGTEESVKTQLESCSGSQLILDPSKRNENIVDGVLDITIDVSVTDFDASERKSLERAVNSKLTSLGYSIRSFGLVMYIMPENAILGYGNVLGYAYVGGVKSVYKGVPNFQTNVHEVGHNLGLSHSGMEGTTVLFYQEYGDTTCQMGYSVALDYYDYPLKCFNGVKSFDLGWYNTEKIGHEVIGIEDSWRGKLVGVHDYFGDKYDGAGPEGHRVIANIGSLYIMFNRAEDFTIDTAEGNTVSVVEKFVEDTTQGINEYSRRKTDGILLSGDTGTYETATGEIFTVVVCDILTDDTSPAELDYAEVIIFRNNTDGSLVQSCAEPFVSEPFLPEPFIAESPTTALTAAPTVAPTVAPIPAPTATPTATLTATPTAGLKVALTTTPTAAPTPFQAPPECEPSGAVLISNQGETMFDPNAPLIRITSQNTTSVNFEVVNTFDATFTSVFTMYTTGKFGEYVCLEETNVQSLSVSSDYSARCMGDNPHTSVKVWVVDGTGQILREGDDVVVPNCCHKSQSPAAPVAMYIFKLPCANPCNVIGSVEQ